jgi:hypothetical protein
MEAQEEVLGARGVIFIYIMMQLFIACSDRLRKQSKNANAPICIQKDLSQSRQPFG